jgi:hypothetical protein
VNTWRNKSHCRIIMWKSFRNNWNMNWIRFKWLTRISYLLQILNFSRTMTKLQLRTVSQQVAFQVYMTLISPQLNNDIFTLYIIFSFTYFKFNSGFKLRKLRTKLSCMSLNKRKQFIKIWLSRIDFREINNVNRQQNLKIKDYMKTSFAIFLGLNFPTFNYSRQQSTWIDFGPKPKTIQ